MEVPLERGLVRPKRILIPEQTELGLVHERAMRLIPPRHHPLVLGQWTHGRVHLESLPAVVIPERIAEPERHEALLEVR